MSRYRVFSVGLDGLNMPLVERFVAEGALPNLARMMREGASAEALPCLPAYTPTNWATLATGSRTGTHGLPGWEVRDLSQRFEQVGVSAFDSRSCRSETIWEAADRQGLRSLVIYHPVSWPATLRNGFVVAPLYSGPGVQPLVIAQGAEYATTPARLGRVHWTPFTECYSFQLELRPDHGGGHTRALAGAIEVREGATEQVMRATANVTRLPMLVVDEGRGYERVLLFEENGRSDGPVLDLSTGQWSRWVERRWKDGRKGAVRFKLLSLDRESGELRLVRSQVYPTEGFTFPETLGAELVREIGPFIEHPGVETSLDPLANETYFEEHRYQARWMSRVAEHVQARHGIDLYMQHYHLIDHVSHTHLAQSDPEWRHYDATTGPRHLEVTRQAYQFADEMVGVFMEQADDRTVVAVVSDHGNVPNQWVTHLGNRLRERGLFYFAGPVDDLEVRARVDWERSSAYVFPMRLLEVFVNLQGREPHGRVRPEDYTRVQEAIIDALLDWREPVSGRRVVAFALKRQDAEMVGLGGDLIGDVVFCYASGFGRMEEPHMASTGHGLVLSGSTGSAAGGSANHGPQPTTARTRMHSNLSSLLLYGPGIRGGYRRDVTRLGHPHLEDYVPTLSHLLGIHPPAQSQGSILWDMLED